MKFSCRSFRHVLAALVIGAVASTARAGIRSERLLAAIIQETPAPRLVADGEQLRTAEKIAALLPAAHALLGVGTSMEPLYASNTAVVVQGVNYENLRKGMTVVYVKSNGRRVAHSIVGETRGGFIVQGVNNDREDTELVTADNYIGVIVQAYASADTAFRTETAQRLASKSLLVAANRG